MIDAAAFGLKSIAREVIPISGDFSSVFNFAASYPIEYHFFLATANYETYCPLYPCIPDSNGRNCWAVGSSPWAGLDMLFIEAQPMSFSSPPSYIDR
jgi:hypothetical protein